MMLFSFLPRTRNLLIKNKKVWLSTSPKHLVYYEPPGLRYSTWIKQKYRISPGSLDKLSFYTTIIYGIYYTIDNFVISNRTKFNYFGGIIDRTLPALVTIEIFYGKANKIDTFSQGSGFIIRQDGLILTNAHVVSRADASYLKIVILDSRGARYLGTIEKIDEVNDLATIRIKKTGLPTVKLGFKSGIRIGDTIISLGIFSEKYHKFINVGNVTRYRQPNFHASYIIANFLIQPGCSGGPTLNKNGKVIGVNKAMDNKNQVMIIPIDLAKKLLPKSIVESFIIETGEYCKMALDYILKVISQVLPISK